MQIKIVKRIPGEEPYSFDEFEVVVEGKTAKECSKQIAEALVTMGIELGKPGKPQENGEEEVEEKEEEAEETEEAEEEKEEEAEETEEEEEVEEEEEEEKPKAKAKPEKVEKKKSLKKKGSTYLRTDETHRHLFAELLDEKFPGWSDKKSLKAKAASASKALNGIDFLDADGEILPSFVVALKKEMK